MPNVSARLKVLSGEIPGGGRVALRALHSLASGVGVGVGVGAPAPPEQAATSIDGFIGPFRLETGVNLQQSVTAGALIGRLTQDLVDDGTYLGGTPLVDLDVNGNGRIGYLEMARASPVAGNPAGRKMET